MYFTRDIKPKREIQGKSCTSLTDFPQNKKSRLMSPGFVLFCGFDLCLKYDRHFVFLSYF